MLGRLQGMSDYPTTWELGNSCDIRTLVASLMNAERQLITVTEVFEIVGRGVFVAPVVPYALIDAAPNERLQRGDQLELRRPDGSVVRVKLCGLAWPSPHQGGLILSLGTSLAKADIPLGTEIWRVSGPT